MESRSRFLLALLIVALASAAFAVAFRFGLSWWYRAVFHEAAIHQKRSLRQ